MKPIQGEVAVVTGGALGLGYTIVKEYARAGMRMAIIDVLADKLMLVTEELRAMGADVLPIVADLSDADATQAAIDRALAHYGTPRVLVHNAALLKERPMREVTYDQWRMETDIILQAAFILSKAVWEPMIAAGGGSIVYLSSGSGLKGFVREVAYCPGKHAQEGLMKVLSMEGAPFNIAVNSVTPGALINTPMSDSHYPDDLKQQWIDPALIAPAFVYLAKLEGSDVTGQRLDAWQIAQILAS
jgi:NAD(P)-dependent dehydrogenase (short-subunit alcohol dehydrogenase family)